MHKLSLIGKRTLFFSFLNLKAAHKEIASNIHFARTIFGSFFFFVAIHFQGRPLLTVNTLFYSFVAFNT